VSGGLELELGSFDEGEFLIGMAVTPDGKQLYLANHLANPISRKVSVIDTATNSVSTEVDVGGAPREHRHFCLTTGAALSAIRRPTDRRRLLLESRRGLTDRQRPVWQPLGGREARPARNAPRKQPLRIY
jgi:YVTN family beta-propeller protein